MSLPPLEGGLTPPAGRGEAPVAAPRPRYFRLTNLAVKNRTSIAVLSVLITMMGVVAYRSIPKESSPEITVPMIGISTVYPGVAPKDMETLVTRVIEEELNKIPEITELTSVSDQGFSSVTAEFDADMDMEEALQKVREKVDLARPKLPADAEDPVLAEFNFADFPIMQVNISGKYDLVRLKEVAEALQDELEQIPALLEVRLSGGLERVVKVDVDLARLKYYNVSFTDVIDAIRFENVTIPGGAIEVGSQDFLVRVAGEFEDTDLIRDIVVDAKAGGPVYVRDVASVDFGFEDRRSYARLDGDAVVTLDIVKRSGENIIKTADAVKAAIDALSPTFPPGTSVVVTSDQSRDIRKMVSSLENNIISGLLLVVAVLLFFLGVRNSMFVAFAVPTSMLLSFLVMQILGVSMNMVVLFSLILALGMLVDNSIVVVENIYRHMEQGWERFEAARRGAGEVAVPVIVSTLTTVAAFAPLMFWPGIAGEFMSYLPLTLIITLTSSLFVALVLTPPLCAVLMRVEHEPRSPMAPSLRRLLIGAGVLLLLVVAGSNPLTAVVMVGTGAVVVTVHVFVLSRVATWFQARGVTWIIARYQRTLGWALAHRKSTIGVAAASFVVTFVAFSFLNAGVEYFPESIPPATVYARIDVPSGTSPEFTNDLANRIEAGVGELAGAPDFESVVATVAGSSAGGGLFASSAEGSVAVNFIDFEDRTTDVFETLRRMQETVGAGLAGADIKVEKQDMGPPSGPPVNIEIVGPEVEVLKTLSDQAIEVLEAAPVVARLEGLKSDMTRGRPELVVEVDRERAALYDLSTSDIGFTVRTAIQGTEAAKFRYGKDEYDIVVRLEESDREDLDALRDLTVMSEGRQIPLNSVAKWRVDEGLGTVRRKDLDRVATLQSDVRTGENSNRVLAEVRTTLADFERQLPPGYTMRYTGQQEDQQEAMDFLSRAFLVALFLIAFILMSEFNSVITPLIIMTSVIMSTVGVLLGLMVFRMPFGIIMTGLGVISLAGVVVNNAIVLIDYVRLLRSRDGLSRDDALMRAGATRFRPVILTAATTVLGLFPLAAGFNFDFFGFFAALSPNIFWGGEQAAWWAPMAIAVMVGLSLATVLTLVLVPVLYSVVDDVGLWFQRTFTPAGAKEAESGLPAEDDAGRDARPRRRRLAGALARFQRGDPLRAAPDGS